MTILHFPYIINRYFQSYKIPIIYIGVLGLSSTYLALTRLGARVNRTLSVFKKLICENVGFEIQREFCVCLANSVSKLSPSLTVGQNGYFS